MISVLMSIYDEPDEWIILSIESILNQTFTDFEFIIINDNPKKKSNSVLLNNYASKDKRIVIIENIKNLGLTKSLNIALNMATRKYIARMDADDISMINRFQVQYDFLETNINYILCGTSRIDFNKDKERTVFLPSSNKEIKTEMLLRNRITHPSVMLRSKVLKENNLSYSEEIKKSQDYNLWAKLSDYGNFFNINQPLIKYRISENQISNKSFNEQYFYSIKNRNLYIKNFFKNINICINKNDAFNKIINLNINERDKEIYLSAYMIFNDVTSINKISKFVFRKGFFSFIVVHKFYIHYLIQKLKNANIK